MTSWGAILGKALRAASERIIMKRLMAAISAKIGDPFGHCGVIIDNKNPGHREVI